MTTTEENRQAFESALAQCITTWANLETELCILFADCVTTSDDRPASAAFFSVVNFQSRLEMVNAVVGYRLDDLQLAEWGPLRNKISRLSRKRNLIAHLQVWGRPVDDHDGVLDFRLAPNVADDRDFDLSFDQASFDKKVFPTKRLRECVKSFAAATKAVKELRRRPDD